MGLGIYLSSSLMTSPDSIILIILIERYTERDSLCVVGVREKELYQLVCVYVNLFVIRLPSMSLGFSTSRREVFVYMCVSLIIEWFVCLSIYLLIICHQLHAHPPHQRREVCREIDKHIDLLFSSQLIILLRGSNRNIHITHLELTSKSLC